MQLRDYRLEYASNLLLRVLRAWIGGCGKVGRLAFVLSEGNAGSAGQ